MNERDELKKQTGEKESTTNDYDLYSTCACSLIIGSSSVTARTTPSSTGVTGPELAAAAAARSRAFSGGLCGVISIPKRRRLSALLVHNQYNPRRNLIQELTSSQSSLPSAYKRLAISKGVRLISARIYRFVAALVRLLLHSRMMQQRTTLPRLALQLQARNSPPPSLPTAPQTLCQLNR